MSLTITDLFIGHIASMQRTFNESDVKLCNELTKDYSPIYQVNKEAWKSNFSKPVVLWFVNGRPYHSSDQ